MLLSSPLAFADERVEVCFGYGCVSQAQVIFSDEELGRYGSLLASSRSATEERALVAQVIGAMYGSAGRQSPIHNDRGGNYADDGVDGKMDCIDHTRTTMRFLQLLASRGWLRGHQIVGEVVRHWAWLFPAHFAVAIAERTGPRDQYVVDSWFVDNGEPAVILPLEAWKEGAGPDV